MTAVPTMILILSAVFLGMVCRCQGLCSVTKYRTPGGDCNNARHMDWGAAHTSYLRLLPPHYDSESGPLPNAEAVVGAVSGAAAGGRHPHITSLLPLWADLVARDLSQPYTSGAILRKRWNSLRDGYRKALSKKKTKSGQATTNIKQWKYEDQMSFLNDHLSEKRKQLSSLRPGETDVQHYNMEERAEHLSEDPRNIVAEEVINEQNTPTQPPKKHSSSRDISSKKSKDGTSNIASVLENYLKQKSQSKNTTSDHVTSFFKSAEDTVRTFNPLLQIEIKSKIASLLSEYEMKNLIAAQTGSAWSTPQSNSSSLLPTPSPTPPPHYGDEQISGDFQHYESNVPLGSSLQNQVPLESTSSSYTGQRNFNNTEFSPNNDYTHL